LLVGAPQPLAQHVHQPDRGFRPALKQRQERAPRHDKQLAIGHRRGVGGALLAVEQRDLAEEIAFVHDRQHHLPAVPRRRADHDPALQHGHHAAAGIVLGEDLLTLGETRHRGVHQDRVELAVAQLRE
jgi:hypothetical protein